MKNRGFTLIELLAVLTILSIILLIAVFSVSSVISNSKKNLQDTQMEQILKAAEYYNSKEGTDDSVQVVSVKTLTEKGYLKNDEVKDPKTGKIIDGVVVIKYNGKKYSYTYREENICKAKSGGVSTDPGTEYECEVKDGTKYNFYILNEEDGKVNLIMNSNICNDGTPADKDHQCNYAWHWQTQEYDEDDNRYGPDIAMINLYNGTKGWINVPDMIMDYDDENNTTDTTIGYTSIMTDETTKVTTITGKQNKTSTNQTFGNTTEPLKARLPREDEVYNTDTNDITHCNGIVGSCPTWLVENLKYYNVTYGGITDKYSMNNGNGITNIYGYWLLSSNPGNSDIARRVHYYGDVSHNDTSYASSNGLRAVITVASSFLSSNSNN